MFRQLTLAAFGVVLAGTLVLAQDGQVTKAVSLPPGVKDWIPNSLRWNGDSTMLLRERPSPQAARLDSKLSFLSRVEMGGFAGASSITLYGADISKSGDIGYIGRAEDADHRSGTFISFVSSAHAAAPTFVKTYPFGPTAIAAMDDGRFIVLLAPQVSTQGEDYPAIRVFDAKGGLGETLLTFKQMHLPSRMAGITSANKANPALASRQNYIFVYIPMIEEIQQWSTKGSLVRSIPVQLPDGGMHDGILGLTVTDNLRIAVTAAENTSKEPGTKPFYRRRVIYTDDGAHWHYLLPNEEQDQAVRGSSGRELVVQLRDDRLVWVQ